MSAVNVLSVHQLAALYTMPDVRCFRSVCIVVRSIVQVVVVSILCISIYIAMQEYMVSRDTVLYLSMDAPTEVVKDILNIHAGCVVYVPKHSLFGVGGAVLPIDYTLSRAVTSNLVVLKSPAIFNNVVGIGETSKYLSIKQLQLEKSVDRVCAMLMVLIYMMIAVILWPKKEWLCALYPVAIVTLNSMYYAKCDACSNYASMVSAGMMYGVIASAIMLSVRFWFNIGNTYLNRIAVMACAMVPAFQSIAFLIVPAFCIKCLLSGFVIYASSLTDSVSHSVQVPVGIRYALCILIVMIMWPSYTNGYQNVWLDIVPLYKGSYWEDHFERKYPGGSVCIVVVNDTCPACKVAIRDLHDSRMIFQIAHVRTAIKPDGAFVANGVPTPTPLYLVYDHYGVCRFVYSGWPLPEWVVSTIRRYTEK